VTLSLARVRVILGGKKGKREIEGKKIIRKERQGLELKTGSAEGRDFLFLNTRQSAMSKSLNESSSAILVRVPGRLFSSSSFGVFALIKADRRHRCNGANSDKSQ
jgi:hypothetical protein